MNSGQKFSLGKSINDVGVQKALSHFQQTGQPLPCTIQKIAGSIVTLAFQVAGGFNLPNVTVPLAECFYSRGGHKVGDKGYATPANAGIGNMSGLGPSGSPGLAKPANLAALVFHPMGHKDWPDTGGKRINQADNGAINQTPDGENQAGAIPGKVLLKAGGVTALLGPQEIAKLASLLGVFSSGGSSSSGGGGTTTTGGTSQMQQLILAYQYVTPASGTAITIADNIVVTVIDPSATLGSLTVAFPASPADGQVQTLSFTHAVTALTLSGASFAANAPAAVGAGGGRFWFQYLAATNAWSII